jgi:hypothetical protein
MVLLKSTWHLKRQKENFELGLGAVKKLPHKYYNFFDGQCLNSFSLFFLYNI